MENPPGKYRRLVPGGEVRLRYAYIIKCEEIVKDSSGEVIGLRCSYDPDTKSGTGQNQRRVKGTIHWVSAQHAARAEVRLYDRLFSAPSPDQAEGDFKQYLNPDSLEIVLAAALEPVLLDAQADECFQFERQGYFTLDSRECTPGGPVFFRTMTLRDSWAKIERQALAQAGG